ncbi:PREDICTED: vicilin-like seed storage protein At2g18540 [Eufriesea mexicana]|uniref:vicilin-like seed storage protein At2g18540 n=1 Tax=Eufriesea mexicana TaxID=516756 RepID=UPI00083C3DAF|nr:PREDICTED: vicilin-like seed storage protein At2g18540 [Eufriesea mexicana]
MVQNQVIQSEIPTVCHQNRMKPMKSVKIADGTVETLTPKSSHRSSRKPTLSMEKTENKNEQSKIEVVEEEPQKKEKITSTKEDIKRRRREERLAREKQAVEEREKFVKETTEKKAAERGEIIKEAKRFILYRKPMCRRINQGLLVSECYRELDAQIKFRETLKNADREEENAYVRMMKEDVAKYEEEMRQKMEKQLKEKREYTCDLKKQIEENHNTITEKQRKRFEAEKQDQINMKKYLDDVTEHEAQQLQNKKEKLKQFFKDAIEEKKQFDLMLKHEEEFEDRAVEIYRNAKLRIQKMHKAVKQKEKEEREKKTQLINEKTSEIHRAILKSKEDLEERILKKAQEEQEEHYREEQRKRKEHRDRISKEVQDFRLKVLDTKSKQLEEEKTMKMWEMMQRFKRVEHDKEVEAEWWKKNWDDKMKYADTLKKYISDKEEERKQAKLDEDEALDVKKIIEIENKKVLDYAEEILNESKGVRPLYPILKAVEDCKREMGLTEPKKKETIVAEPKRRRRIRRCTKYVPEDKIHYL